MFPVPVRVKGGAPWLGAPVRGRPRGAPSHGIAGCAEWGVTHQPVIRSGPRVPRCGKGGAHPLLLLAQSPLLKPAVPCSAKLEFLPVITVLFSPIPQFLLYILDLGRHFLSSKFPCITFLLEAKLHKGSHLYIYCSNDY